MERKSGLIFRAKNSLLWFLIKVYVRGAMIHRVNANALFSICRKFARSAIDIWALPLVWMDESAARAKGLLRPSSSSTSFGPNYIGRVQAKENIFLPDIYYFAFEKARISATSSSVILKDEQVVIERAIGPAPHICDYAAGHILVHKNMTAVARLGSAEAVKNGIFLGGNGSSNYYHWMVELLAKLEFIPKLPEHYRQYPLIVSEDVVRIPSFKETLDVFAAGHELIVLRKDMSYVVDELVYINSPSNLPFNLSGNQKFECKYVTIDSLSIAYLRKIALQAAEKSPQRADYPQKIFLCRKSGLRNFNQDEIFDYLATRGFTKVFMEDMGFLEQVNIVHHADFIVGPTGAAWTNLIFCKSGAKGLCWMAEEFGDFSAYSNIAHIVGVDLQYVAYKAGVYSTGELYYQDYHIELSMIEKGLASLSS